MKKVAFNHMGTNIIWSGSGVNEIGKDSKNGKVLVQVHPRLFRATEVDILVGDASKAKNELGWEPKTSLEELVKIMVDHDYKLIKYMLENNN